MTPRSRGATTFLKLGVQFLGLGYCTEQNTDGIPAQRRSPIPARDLGVILDSQLSLCDHIAAICRAGFYQLRQIRPATQIHLLTYLLSARQAGTYLTVSFTG